MTSRSTLPAELPISVLGADTVLTRLHALRHAPTPQHRQALHRFDDPERGFGVCYLAESLAGAFVETFLREGAGRVVSTRTLAQYARSTFRLSRTARLVDLHGAGLRRLGHTASLFASEDYQTSQMLSAAIFSHPSAVDGVRYRCRHDPDCLAVALFERAHGLPGVWDRPIPMAALADEVGAVLDRYEAALVDD